MDQRQIDKISVIVPVFNAEVYIDRCIKSLIQQSWQELEMILVDDGSSDGSLSLCELAAENDSRIRVFSQKNQGQSVARNLGIQMATGRYLCFVDADDYVEQDYVARLHQLLCKTDADISMCGFQYFTGNRQECQAEEKEEQMELITGHQILVTMHAAKDEPFVVVWGKLFKRELFDGIEFPPGRVWEDYAVLYRLFERAEKLAITDRVLYQYFRGNASSATYCLRDQFFDDMRYVLKKEIGFMEEKGYVDILILIKKRYMYWLIYEYRYCERNRLQKSEIVKEYKDLFRSVKGNIKEKMYHAFYVSPVVYTTWKAMISSSGR